MQLGKRHSAGVSRCRIRGFVLCPETQHLQQIRVVKLRQQTRGLHKTTHAVVERLAILLAAQHQLHVIAANSQRSRHKLVDRHRALELVIPRFIHHVSVGGLGDLLNLKFVEAETRRQSVGKFWVVIFISHDGLSLHEIDEKSQITSGRAMRQPPGHAIADAGSQSIAA
ncbi:hypothetical protein D3C75_591430 [compost metagenome]